ncbi:MAG: A/G-specific adenine glycosylase [Pseudomonadota bacterium]|nr:A/G-specific adenine glycosylase [Pseudomonadota bacterium]
MPSDPKLRSFAPRLIAWQKQHGRHALPWQGGIQADAYPVWLSEIMLQQTQVETVIPYFQRFLASFPDLATLAAAHEDVVLGHWSGLGYYSRARNLHAAARRVVAEHGGQFPRDIDAILALPGIGRSTAAAIAAFAFNERRAILDGNVKRVLARVFGIEGWPGEKMVENRLWALAETLLPDADIRAYTQGLMDLGATVCTRGKPRCERCPYADDCIANIQCRQRELPAARPKKVMPEKSTAMLVLLNAGEVLLEKRPNSGIWGGLWSLPEFPEQDDPQAAASRLGYQAVRVDEMPGELPGFKHSFTHFRLYIQPWRLQVSRSPTAAEPGRIWLSLDDLDGAALPTPVRRILEALSQ